MRLFLRLLVVASLAVLLASASSAVSKTSYSKGCNTRACEVRVCKSSCQARLARKIRARAASAWGPVSASDRAWLNKVGSCEADSSGGYRLYTTGNGFYFRYQFTSSSWVGAGGRLVGGLPVGVGSRLPSPAEQDHRALVVRSQQGTGAWPVCG